MFCSEQGTNAVTSPVNYLDPAILSRSDLFTIQNQCLQNSTFQIPFLLGSTIISQKGMELHCFICPDDLFILVAADSA